MYDTELYRQILGVESPWAVDRVDLNVEALTVHVYLEFKPQAPVRCPKCACVVPGYDHLNERAWRHLDSCQFLTYLVTSVPRFQCPEHGVFAVDVPWSHPHSRFTLLFESFAIDVLLAMKVQGKAGALLPLSPGQMHDLMRRAVKRGLDRRDKSEEISHLTLDEKSFHNGHKYITVLGDAQHGRVIDITESRTFEATNSLIVTSLSAAQRTKVVSVSMDMWAAFMSATTPSLPGADIVHDRFHVAQYLNRAVDQTRRTEHRALRKEGTDTLNKSKYIWLKNPENHSTKQQELFDLLREKDLMTATVWSFKETFRDFYSCKTASEAELFFHMWYDSAIALAQTALTKVAKMLKNHLPGLLAYFRNRVTNAVAEQINGQVQVLKVVARGFRRFDSFRIAILFFLGKLSLYPQTSP